ncbi:imidazole glycerol phosphate synthase subunit HisH [Synechococcus sp. GFB01]|uniref:imidazole glycerol phosphate synthase subunit HisH n=1 Tax=Synechococcus sp. GFB01 TaxID=1662190 RepID=UPI00064F3346|nr:imidazole glycerol phosphate synthase subunit HisH [Synechococcus sp. GFB01]KMM16536.1 glutamine amidotransferase [Synechococcus sp. GFB01]
MSRIGLIDYGMGNLHSVQRAFERLGATLVPVLKADGMEGCDALILPGVGAFDPAMERLDQSGLAASIRHWCDAGKPLLGICLGLQLLFERSEEGEAAGLGVLAGTVQALPRRPGHPIPHMGWEPLLPASPSPLLPADTPETWVYFVHSYAAVPNQPACTTAKATFADTTVTAAVWQGCIGACQFHPEKSGPHGQAILRRWLHWLDHDQARKP